MMRRIFSLMVLATLGALAAAPAGAQTTYQSSDGSSSLTLRDGGLLHVNFSDANVSFGLVRQVSTDRWRVGVDGKLAAKDGFVSLVDDGFTLGSGSVSGFVGYDFLPKNSKLQYGFLAGRMAYTRASLSILPDASTTLDVEDKTFNGATTGVVFNGFLDTASGNGGGEEILFGIAVDYGRFHNADTLDSVEVCEESRFVTTATQSIRNVSSCKAASAGAYEISNRVTVALDVLWYQNWSDKRLALAFLGRHDDLKHQSAFVPGIGVFVAEEKKPLRLQGGFTVEWDDGHPKLGLQVGFPF